MMTIRVGRQKDQDVRQAAHALLEKTEPFLMDEFNLHDCRADMVSIHDSYITGYALKSASDNLLRLPRQIKDYSSICRYNYLIVSDTYYQEALDMLPEYWGVIMASYERPNTRLMLRREAHESTALRKDLITTLLWRDETLELLKSHHLDKGVHTKPRPVLWERLADNFTLPEIEEMTCKTILARTSYRYGNMPDHK
jgi:hypothetical protein